MGVLDYSDQPHPIQRAMEYYGVHLEYGDLKKISRYARDHGEKVKKKKGVTVYRIVWNGNVMYPVLRKHIVVTFYRKGYL